MKKFLSFLLTFVMLFSLAMPAMAAEETKIIYFENTDGWDTVNAYYWDNANAGISWPSAEMTKVEGEESIYAIEVPTDEVNIIFNDGSDSQTVDLTIPTDGKNLYNLGTGTWSTYGSTGGINGNTTGDVSATFDPEITISGISYSGDTVTYDANSGNYVLLIPADLPDGDYIPFSYIFEGTNLQYVPEYDDNAQYDLWVRVADSSPYSEDVPFSEFVGGVMKEYIDGNLIVQNGASLSIVGLTCSLSYSNNNRDNTGTWSEPVSLAFKKGYSITASETVNGTVAVPEYAAEGDTVYLTVTPEDGYELETLVITGPEGEISHTKAEDGRYKFIMPAGNVTISATFMESTTEPTPEALWGIDIENLTESGTLAEAFDAANAAGSTVGYIQLQTNVTDDGLYSFNSGIVTLDLNGKTLSTSNVSFYVVGDNEVTLTDTAEGGAVISSGASTPVCVNGGKLVIDAGSYTGWDALWVQNGGVVELNGGTFTGTDGYAVALDGSSTLNITGGTFSGDLASVNTNDNDTATITGGTFAAGTDGQISYMAGTLDLSGYDAVDGLTLSQRERL